LTLVRALIALAVAGVFTTGSAEDSQSFRNANGPGVYEMEAFRAWTRIAGKSLAKDSTVRIMFADSGKLTLSDSVESVPARVPVGKPLLLPPLEAKDIEKQIIAEMGVINREYQARGFDTLYEHPYLPFDRVPKPGEELLTLVAVYRFPGHSDLMLLRYLLEDEDNAYSYPTGTDFLVLTIVSQAKAYVLYCYSGLMDWNFSRILRNHPKLFGEDWALAALLCVSSVSEEPLAILGSRQDLETAVRLRGQFRRIPLAKGAPPEDALWLTYPASDTSLVAIARTVARTDEDDSEIRRVGSLRPSLLEPLKVTEERGMILVTVHLLNYRTGSLSRWMVSFGRESSVVRAVEVDRLKTGIFLKL
jgi:hypothetical protein